MSTLLKSMFVLWLAPTSSAWAQTMSGDDCAVLDAQLKVSHAAARAPSLVLSAGLPPETVGTVDAPEWRDRARGDARVQWSLGRRRVADATRDAAVARCRLRVADDSFTATAKRSGLAAKRTVLMATRERLSQWREETRSRQTAGQSTTAEVATLTLRLGRLNMQLLAIDRALIELGQAPSESLAVAAARVQRAVHSERDASRWDLTVSAGATWRDENVGIVSTVQLELPLGAWFAGTAVDAANAQHTRQRQAVAARATAHAVTLQAALEQMDSDIAAASAQLVGLESLGPLQGRQARAEYQELWVDVQMLLADRASVAAELSHMAQL